MNKDQYWLNICNTISENSKCLSRKIAAIIVKDDKFIISTGYSGPPAGYKHCETICPRKGMGFKTGEGIEYCPSAHAERNAISIAAKLGHSTDKCNMYLNTIIPCFECAKSIINSGIREIIVTDLINYDKRGITGKSLFEQSGVKIRKFKL